MKILLGCAFARGNENPMLDQIKNGVHFKQALGNALSDNFGRACERDIKPYAVIFPELAAYFLTPSDKEVIFNTDRIKEYIIGLIKLRKSELEKGVGLDNGDFLTILLQDELY